jgi:hypothetical protein
MPYQPVLCNGEEEEKCKVRQISVFFPRMDEENARAVAKKGVELFPNVTTVVFLKIDVIRRTVLEETNEGVRMFFHASESKKFKWWKNNISRLDGSGEQFVVKRKDDMQAAARHKLWEDEKYACFKRELIFFPESTKYAEATASAAAMREVTEMIEISYLVTA